MTEISNAIAEAIRKRATSATLGTYLLFWATYHWQGLYATFFVNQDLIYGQHGLLKNEYVDKYFFGINSWDDWQFYLGIIVPAIFTCVFIWLLPHYVLIHAYRQEQRHKVRRRITKLEEELALQKTEESLARQEKQTLEAEIKTSEKKKEARKTDPTILWKEELETVRNTPQFKYLGDLLECIYRYKGYVEADDQYGDPVFGLNPNSLRFGDSRDIINISDNGERITLTEKGKFFASEYAEEF